MIRFNPQASIRPTAKAKSFLDYLKEREIFPRRVDAYAFAAALALSEELEPRPDSLKGRADLVDISYLDEDVRLALAASIQQRMASLPFEIVDESSLLDAFVYLAERGCEELQERWKEKSRSQMMADLSRIL